MLTGSVSGVDDAQEGDDDGRAGNAERENRPDAEREGNRGDADARIRRRTGTRGEQVSTPCNFSIFWRKFVNPFCMLYHLHELESSDLLLVQHLLTS